MKKALIVVAKVLAFFIGWAVIIGLIDVPSSNPAIWRFWAEFIPFVLVVVFSVVFWIIEKKRFPVMQWEKAPFKIFAYAFIGLLWLGIPVLILYVTKTISFEASNHVGMLVVWTISCLLNVVMQELLVRGYIYQLIKKEYNTASAIIATTALFTFLHGGAFAEGIVPVLCVVSMSVAMSIVMEYTKSLVAPIVLHFVWNCLGSIIFNVVAMAEDYPHILNAAFSGSKLMTGGDCLMEGSIVVLLVNILLVAVYLALYRKNSAKSIQRVNPDT